MTSPQDRLAAATPRVQAQRVILAQRCEEACARWGEVSNYDPRAEHALALVDAADTDLLVFDTHHLGRSLHGYARATGPVPDPDVPGAKQ